MFYGYRQLELSSGQQAFIACPEKALLDLIYLQPGGDSPAYLESLRLQNLEQFDLDKLHLYAEESGKPKLLRGVDSVRHVVSEYLDAIEIV